MTGGGCAASIKRAVAQVPGVSSAKANQTSKDVVVEASADVSDSLIMSGSNAAGSTKITLVNA
jgi:copper chaperone CopZ